MSELNKWLFHLCHRYVYLQIVRQLKQMIAADKGLWEKMGWEEGKLTFCLANPGSITNTTPSMVRDVSAMFVDTTTYGKGSEQVKK